MVKSPSIIKGRRLVEFFSTPLRFQATLIPRPNLLRHLSATFLFALLQSFFFAFLESSS